MTEMNCRDCKLEVHGYLDNELETDSALAVHKHLTSCKDCQNYCRQIRQTMRLVREQAAYYETPDALSDKIRVTIEGRSKSIASGFMTALLYKIHNWDMGAFVPATSFAALACAVFLYVATPANNADWVDEAVSDHVRSLMAQHITDVPSSDRHTVKPWFISKLDFAPPVFDFTAQGFALVGGRMDYLQSQTAAALVYEHNKHIINLFIMPTAEADSLKQDNLKKRGYNLVTWQKNHMKFIAISDMDANGLNEFGKLLQDAIVSS